MVRTARAKDDDVAKKYLGRPHRCSFVMRYVRDIVWISMVAVAFCTPANAETVLLARETLPLEVGLELDYHTDQRKGFVDVYTSRITILEIRQGSNAEPTQVKFRWRMFQARRHAGWDETGTITTTGFVSGTAFNAWWTAGTDIVTKDTHVWLSQEACERLLETGATTFNLDVNMRRDRKLVLTRVEESTFETTVDGAPRQLPAISMTSEHGDKILMLADCRHPLVLEIELPNLYLWKLEAIRFLPRRELRR